MRKLPPPVASGGEEETSRCMSYRKAHSRCPAFVDFSTVHRVSFSTLRTGYILSSRRFSFHHTSELSVSALDSIMCRISALPCLDTLTLHAYSHDYPMKHQQQFFSYFHHLRDITITGQMIDAIPHIIAKSPGLFRLRLVSTEPVTNLHSVLDLFPVLPPAFRCSVEQLTLEGNFTLPQPDIVPVIPHLRHLTSLRLLIHDISDAFWTALSVESIHVKEISVDIGSDALLDYLCSYSGITMMMLIVDRGVIEAGALKFWNQVLPRHANTMKRTICPLSVSWNVVH